MSDVHYQQNLIVKEFQPIDRHTGPPEMIDLDQEQIFECLFKDKQDKLAGIQSDNYKLNHLIFNLKNR